MAWMKLVLLACFCMGICQGFNPKKFSTSDFLPPGLPVPDFLNKSLGAWDCFKNLTDAHKGDKMEFMPNLKNYFSKFGYLSIPDGQNLTEDFDETLESAVKMYQRNFGLEETGNLDAATVSQLMTPRCGREDVINGTSVMLPNSGRHLGEGFPHAVRHYTFFPGSPRWSASNRNLTYAFAPNDAATAGISLTDMRAAFARAFQRWADVIPMTFTETGDYRNADLHVGFFSWDHGDGEPFDGPLGTLAHAFSPENGRFHLDASESWSVDFNVDSSSRAIDLESVATHEIGHLLGLGHTNVHNAIMYPSIAPRSTKVDLAQDDVDGVQSLYGANPNYNASAIPTTQKEEVSHGSCLLSPSLLWSSPFIFLASYLIM